MGVPANKLPSHADAVEVATACVETANALLQALKDVRKGGPAGVAATSASREASRALARLAKTTRCILDDAEAAWKAQAEEAGARGSRAIAASSPPQKQKQKQRKAPLPAAARPATAPATARRGLGPPERVPTPPSRRSPSPSVFGSLRSPPVEAPLGSLASPLPPGFRVPSGDGDGDGDGYGEEEDLRPRGLRPPTPTAAAANAVAVAVAASPTAGLVVVRPASASAAAKTKRAPTATWEKHLSRQQRAADERRAREREAKEEAVAARRRAVAARSRRPEKSPHFWQPTAESLVTETVRVRRAGTKTGAVAIIHRRAMNASRDVAKKEYAALLRAARDKLGMGVKIAALIDPSTGDAFDYVAASLRCSSKVDLDMSADDMTPTPTTRAFPAGVTFVALTSNEVARRRETRADALALALAPPPGYGTLEADEAALVNRLSEPTQSAALIHVSRVGRRWGASDASDADAGAGPSDGLSDTRAEDVVSVVIPRSVELFGDVLARVTETLKAHELAQTRCVALYRSERVVRAGDEEDEEDAPNEITRVEELKTGDLVFARCVGDLAPGMARNISAARRQARAMHALTEPITHKTDALVEVDVAPLDDPTGESFAMRLPELSKLRHLTFEDVCRRVRIAAALPSETRVRALFKFNGEKLASPSDIRPGMRLLYSERRAARSQSASRPQSAASSRRQSRSPSRSRGGGVKVAPPIRLALAEALAAAEAVMDEQNNTEDGAPPAAAAEEEEEANDDDADADGVVVEDDDDDLEEIEIEPEKLPTPAKPPSGRPQTAPRGGRKTAAAATSPKKNAVAVGTPPPPEEDVPLDWDRALPRFMPSPTPSSPTPPSPTRENVLVSPGRLRPLRTSASAKKAAAPPPEPGSLRRSATSPGGGGGGSGGGAKLEPIRGIMPGFSSTKSPSPSPVLSPGNARGIERGGSMKIEFAGGSDEEISEEIDYDLGGDSSMSGSLPLP